MIRPEKRLDLEQRLAKLGVSESDLQESFIRGSGKGGQKINKTANCVYLKHLETGIEVKSQQTRSREDNRFFARRELCERLEQKWLGLPSAKQKRDNKIQKQKARRRRRKQQKKQE